MLAKVDVLMPSKSLYEVQHHFAQKLFEAFVRAGLSCRLLEGDDRYLVPIHSPPDFTIGFNGGLQVEEGQMLADIVRIPHVACLIDPPFRFLNLISSPYTIITCDDRFCCDFVHALNCPNVVFLPHAVEPELAPNPDLPRIYEVAMLATFIDCEKRRLAWRTSFPPDICQAMEEAIEASLGDDTTPFILAVQQALHPLLHTASGALAIPSEMYYRIYAEVEIYIKGRDRLDLLAALPECQVHIFGSSIDERGWQEHFKGHPHIIVHPAVSYEQALQVMQQSKIVLNSCIKNKTGAHERIFSAAACGAVCVTNENEFLKAYFQGGQDMLFYRRQELEKLAPAITRLLEDEPHRAAVAQKGRDIVMSHHTWDHRVRHLLNTIPPMIKRMRLLHTGL